MTLRFNDGFIKLGINNHWWNLWVWVYKQKGRSKVYNIVPLSHSIKTYLHDKYLTKRRNEQLKRNKHLI